MHIKTISILFAGLFTGLITALAQSEPSPGVAADANGSGAAAVPDVTEITADSSDFDEHEHRAIFIREVIVKNPSFNINSEKLTAYLKHQDAAVATPDPKPKPAPKGWPKAPAGEAPPPVAAKTTKTPEDSTGGIEKAIAEGSVIVTQDKLQADGTTTHSVGHSRKAVYEASTGDITMTGKPTCEQNENTCVALADETVIILNRDGKMRAIGPNQMLIKHMQSDPATKKGASDAPATQ